mgnify:CR=1 FL=1
MGFAAQSGQHRPRRQGGADFADQLQSADGPSWGRRQAFTLVLLREDLPAEIGELRELIHKGFPAPADLGALQGIGVLQPVVVVGEIQGVHPDALQALPAEIFR